MAGDTPDLPLPHLPLVLTSQPHEVVPLSILALLPRLSSVSKGALPSVNAT